MAFQGDLFDFPLIDIIWFLGNRNKSGWLTLVNSSTEMVFTFQRGKLVAARSTDTSQRLGQRLIEDDSLSQAQLDEALAMQANEEIPTPVGTILVQLGFIQHNQLQRAISKQFGELIFRLLIHPTGSFCFDPGVPDMRGEPINVTIETEVFEALRRADEWTAQRIHDSRFCLNPAITRETAQLVEAEDRDLVRMLIQGPLNLQEIVQTCGRTESDVINSITRLQASGVLYIQLAESNKSQLVA